MLKFQISIFFFNVFPNYIPTFTNNYFQSCILYQFIVVFGTVK